MKTIRPDVTNRITLCKIAQSLVFVTVITLLFATSVLGTPVVNTVSGTFEDGQTVIVTGTDFTEKASAPPIVFSKFDNSGNNGQLFQDINSDFWDTYSDNPVDKRPKLSNANPRYPGADLSASIYMDRVDYQNDHIYKNRIFTQKIFVSFWVRFDPGSPSTHDGQVKLWRICKSTEPNNGPWIYFREHKGPAYTLHRWDSDGADVSSSWYGNSLPSYEWTNVTVQMDQGTSGNEDGSLRIWHNGKLKVSEDNLNFVVDPNYRFESIRFGEYVGNDAPLVAKAWSSPDCAYGWRNDYGGRSFW